MEGTRDDLPVHRSKLHIRLVSTAAHDNILTGPPDGWDQTLRVKLGDWIAGGVVLKGQNPGGSLLGQPVGRPPQEDAPNAIRTADLRFVVLGEEISAEEIQRATQFTTDIWSQAAIRFNILEQVFTTPVRNILTVRRVMGEAISGGTISITVKYKEENKEIKVSVQEEDDVETIAKNLADTIMKETKLPAFRVQYREEEIDRFFGQIVLVNKGHNVQFSVDTDRLPSGIWIEAPTLNFDFSEEGELWGLELSCLSLNFRDDDPSTIDVFVVGDAKIMGVAEGAAGGDWLKDRNPAWHNVIFVQKGAVTRKLLWHPTTLAHELGHVLLNAGHEDDPFNLMYEKGGLVNSVDAPRRDTQDQHERARKESGPGSAGPVLLKKK